MMVMMVMMMIILVMILMMVMMTLIRKGEAHHSIVAAYCHVHDVVDDDDCDAECRSSPLLMLDNGKLNF